MPQSAPPEPCPYLPDRTLFTRDRSGGDIVIRPNQFLARAPSGPRDVIRAARLIIIDLEAAKAGLRRRHVRERFGRQARIVARPILDDWYRFEVAADVDVLRLVEALREIGVTAQPNHVHFVTTLRQFAPNLFAPNLFAPNLFAPNLFAPNLFAPNLFAPNLFAGGGGGAGGCCGCPQGPADMGTRQTPRHGARPAPAPQGASDAVSAVRTAPNVSIHVIDVARPGHRWWAGGERPAHVTGELVDPDERELTDAIDENFDRWVDPAMGHGDFVTSIVQLNSELSCTQWHAADPLGDIDDEHLKRALRDVDETTGDDPARRKILNLSLAGYNENDEPDSALAEEVARLIAGGWIIVASAGNNASCRLAWPAALPGVVAVGAIGECGPAWFSNYGPWVDASARGVDVLAEFPRLAELPLLEESGDSIVAEIEPFPPHREGTDLLLMERFSTGWATWSGTSFSAPLVTARLARRLADVPPDVPREEANRRALDAVIRDPARPRHPYFGTIVS